MYIIQNVLRLNKFQMVYSRKCSVLGCDSLSNKETPFFNVRDRWLPLNPEGWKVRIKNKYICKNHFRPEDICRPPNKTPFLKPNSNPVFPLR